MTTKIERIERVRLDRDGRLRSNGRIVRGRVDKSRLNSPAAFSADEDAHVLTARELRIVSACEGTQGD
jgi:hypothetical protein